MKLHIFKIIIVIVAFVALSNTAFAACDPLPSPKGDILLTITGNVECANNGDKADFDRTMLEQLPTTALTTTTPWTKGEQNFKGVLLSSVLRRAGVSGKTLLATAHNDYQVEIPLIDADKDSVLLAMEHNGEVLNIRTLGPLRVIYPDTNSNPESYSRMIWQLRTLEARD